MKYIEVYEKMIEVYQKVPGIRRKLCLFYEIKEDSETPIREIISLNSKFDCSIDLLKEFINKFYKMGGIDDEHFKEIEEFINKDDKKINRIIFAAGDKIDATLDVTYNEISIRENDEKYLIYQQEEFTTVTSKDLLNYFRTYENLDERILRFSTELEKKFYWAYMYYLINRYSSTKEFDLGEYPEMLPQYALKNRTKTIFENGGRKEVIHRVDFAFVLNKKIVLIELDGWEHYADKNFSYYNINLDRISDERSIDRELTLEGYEVYRFLNSDIDKKDENELANYLTPFGLMSIFWTQKVKLFYAALLANNSH